MASCKKPVRVWSCDRKLRYGIVGETWEQLKLKIDSKFALGGQDFSLVLEEDGTVVDASFWEALEAQKRLIVLKKEEVWQAPPVSIPNFLSYSKDLLTCESVEASDVTDSAAGTGGGAHHTIHMFIELQNNPAALALLNTKNLEVIKDIDLDDILHKEGSYGLDKEFCKRIQEMSIELYVKRRTEEEALEFVHLLKEHNVAPKSTKS